MKRICLFMESPFTEKPQLICRLTEEEAKSFPMALKCESILFPCTSVESSGEGYANDEFTYVHYYTGEMFKP